MWDVQIAGENGLVEVGIGIGMEGIGVESEEDVEVDVGFEQWINGLRED